MQHLNLGLKLCVDLTTPELHDPDAGWKSCKFYFVYTPSKRTKVILRTCVEDSILIEEMLTHMAADNNLKVVAWASDGSSGHVTLQTI